MEKPIEILVYAEDHVINESISHIPDGWKILIASTRKELEENFERTCSILVIQDSLLSEDPLNDLESIVELNYPTKIIMYHTSLNLKTVFLLFNKKAVDYIISNIDKELKDILISAAEDYNNEIYDVWPQETLKSRINSPTTSVKTDDNLLNLSLELSESREIKDFSNQFLAMIEGFQSFITVNYSIYQDSPDLRYQDIIFNYLADAELLANQYDQKILMIYIEALRSHLSLIFGDFEAAMDHYDKCIRIFYWISDEYIDKQLVDIIREFPIQKDDYYYIRKGERQFEFNEEMKVQIKEKIDKLLNYNISKLINLTEQFYQNLHIEDNVIQTIMVVRDSLPIYIYDKHMEDMDPVLVTGFVEALSSFLQELTSGSGNIDQINHDVGTILIHKENNLRYLLVASHDELYLRMGLRQFANKTSAEMEKIPPNDEASEEQYERYSHLIEDLFYSKKLKNE